MPPGSQVRFVRVRARPTFGSAGTAVGLHGIGQDVTDEEVPAVTLDPPGA